MPLRERLLEHLRKRFEDDPLPLRIVFSDGSHFDFAPHTVVTITFHSAQPLKALLHGNFGSLGDAYVSGDLSADGHIEDLLSVGLSLAARLGDLRSVRRLSRLASLVPRRRSKASDAANVSYHYDVGNEFYRLWLDERMVYSCAYFRTGPRGHSRRATTEA
jgi:cyclopropane-fatty-acyl-phospholipid synthase